MQRKLMYVVIGIFLLLLITVGVFASQKYFIPKKVHYHAGFVIFEKGQKVDFSDNKYMHEAPCNAHEGVVDNSSETIQMEKAHLHDNVGDVVHVHREGAKWKDLFTNMKYPLDYSIITVYMNGNKIENFQSYPINLNDSAVIFIGSVDESLLFQAITREHIEEISTRSESCGS